MLFSLVAYSLTGKDTLYKNIHQLEKLGWLVFGPNPNNEFVFPGNNACRIALADKLKFMVCLELGMDQIENPSSVHPSITATSKMSANEWVESGQADKLKDIPPSEVNLPLQGKTFRQWLIDYGWEKKQNIALSYFVDLIAPEVSEKLSQNFNVFVTDTRYPYEVLPGAITIRLFRSDVPIADESVHSERSMDGYKCSYVFCKNQEDFEILNEKQSQYNGYICYGLLSGFVHPHYKECNVCFD